MPLTLFVKSTDDEVRLHREALARGVLDHLSLHAFERRLLCFLDDEDWHTFKKENGVANRGFYMSVRPAPGWRGAPRYLLDRLFVYGDKIFDDLVYLHGNTCANDVSLTMTLAHELQHFIQGSTRTRLWAANTLVPRLPKAVLNQLSLRWCDIPHEREARIVSKRCAEHTFGIEAVRIHIETAIAVRVTDDDVADWECIRGLSTSAPFDLAAETNLFFPRLKPFRTELEKVLQDLQRIDPNFADVDLVSLLGS
jgi:hypothetical protein